MQILKCLGKIANEKTFLSEMKFFTYGFTLWGAASKGHIMRVEIAQRALFKTAYGRSYRYPTDALY